jgi:hypothetical protein
MKKIILSMTILLMMGLSSFAAGTGNDHNEAVQAFRKDFAGATNVVWEQNNNLLRVNFTFNGLILSAYYSNEGELQAVVRNISSDQLPISLLTDLKKNYGNYWISDLFELVSGDQTHYYITLENADKKIVLKSAGLSQWEQYSKVKKDNAQ